MNLNRPEIEALVEMYALANTPAYLYRRMRSSPVVQRMADDVPTQKLISQFRKMNLKSARSVDDVALAYASLIALTLKKKPPSREIFKKLEAVDLDWGPHIIEMFLLNPISTTTVDFVVPPSQIRMHKSMSTSATELHIDSAPTISTTLK